RFDLRRTLRASLQTGGEPLAPRWLRRPRRAPHVVVLIDGSRSMSGYVETALTLAAAMAAATPRAEIFTFSTAVRRVTPGIRLAAAGRPTRLERLETAWGGGTDIGASLRAFLHTAGERLVRRDTVVVIVSDGLDVGEPSALRDAMREIHRRSAGIVWLNPLRDTPGYEPTAAGMRAARPYVSTFTSVSDADGLARLAREVKVRR
ncbi:MAG: VWA domain-containing protein, partial [Acidobacteriota bacterium]|nr:VWA domain-containing protein [Acidobacteriota bacterium]